MECSGWCSRLNYICYTLHLYFLCVSWNSEQVPLRYFMYRSTTLTSKWLPFDSTEKYLAYVTRAGSIDRDEKLQVQNENGFLWDDINIQSDELSSEEKLQRDNAFEVSVDWHHFNFTSVLSLKMKKIITWSLMKKSSKIVTKKDEILEVLFVTLAKTKWYFVNQFCCELDPMCLICGVVHWWHEYMLIGPSKFVLLQLEVIY